MALTPEQRKIRAKIAISTRWASEDPTVNAQRGQQGLRDKFLREIREKYPDIPEQQQARRAEHLYKAHMGRLALAASKKRSRKAGDAA